MKNTNNEKEKLKEFVKRVEDRTNDVLDDSLMDDDANSENINVDYTDIVKKAIVKLTAESKDIEITVAYSYIFDFYNCNYTWFYVFQ